MCLAVPAEIQSIDENNVATCKVGEGSATVTASLMVVDEPCTIGDFVIIHAGFAIRKLDPLEAEQSLEILRELVAAAAEQGIDVGDF